MRTTLTALTLVAVAVATGQEPISIGIMRQDGLLIPLVQLRGSTVSSLGSGGDPSMMSPDARIAEAGEWAFWDRGGSRPVTIRLSDRTVADFGYSRHEVWRTSLAGRAVSRHAPVEKLGIATHGVIVATPADVVSSTDHEFQRIRQSVNRLALLQEGELLKTDASHPLHKYPYATRASTSIRLDKLWRRHANGGDTYYFEATKLYDAMPMLTTGWIVVSGGKTTTRDITLSTADDSYKDGVFRTVLGIVPLRGRELWVIESRFYEGESYSIREWPSGRCVWSLENNGC